MRPAGLPMSADTAAVVADGRHFLAPTVFRCPTATRAIFRRLHTECSICIDRLRAFLRNRHCPQVYDTGFQRHPNWRRGSGGRGVFRASTHKLTGILVRRFTVKAPPSRCATHRSSDFRPAGGGIKVRLAVAAPLVSRGAVLNDCACRSSIQILLRERILAARNRLPTRTSTCMTLASSTDVIKQCGGRSRR